MDPQIDTTRSLVPQYIEKCCELAQVIGTGIDLANIGYGVPHRGDPNRFIDSPSSYYFFLAGFIRSQKITRVLEIGTHCGGSIRAMMRGIHGQVAPDKVKFVTADLTRLNEEAFQTPPDDSIIRLQGDASKPELVERIVSLFDSQPIDLLFIDAAHCYEPTALQINAFANSLQPKWIILDDIHLNESMESLWRDLKTALGESCFDATALANRPQDVGFGVMLMHC